MGTMLTMRRYKRLRRAVDGAGAVEGFAMCTELEGMDENMQQSGVAGLLFSSRLYPRDSKFRVLSFFHLLPSCKKRKVLRGHLLCSHANM